MIATVTPLPNGKSEVHVTNADEFRAVKVHKAKLRVRANKIALLRQQQKTRIERISDLKVTLDTIVMQKQLEIDNLVAVQAQEMGGDVA